MGGVLARLISSGLNTLRGRKVTAPIFVDRRKQPRRASAQNGTLIWNDARKIRQFEPAGVKDVSATGFAVRLSRPLSVGQMVLFEPRSGPIVKGVVRYCEPEGGHYSAGVLRIDREQRRVTRDPVRGKGSLDWYGEGGSTQSIPAEVRNASEFGLQVVVSRPPPVGRVARLTGDRMSCEGTVCYCVPSNGGYFVGLHFSRGPYLNISAGYHEET